MKIDSVTICVACLVGIAFITYFNNFFTRKDNEEKIKTVKSWLLFCVVKMENIYGSGTGQLKLRAAWDLALQRFPFLSVLVSFDEFSTWVDEALEQMKAMLTNDKLQNFITTEIVP